MDAITILISCCSGRQGLMVARSLLQEKKHRIRCYVRNTKDPEYKELERMGAKLYQGDLEDNEALRRAMTGADCCFLDIDFWDYPEQPEKQLRMGKLFVDNCKTCGIRYLILSSYEDAEKMVHNKYKIPEYTPKARIADYSRQVGVSIAEIRPAFIMEMFLTKCRPIKRPDHYEFNIPMADKRLDLISLEDIGEIVRHMFSHPERYIGKSIGVAGDTLTGREIAEAFSRMKNKKAIYKPMTIEEYRKINKDTEKLGLTFRFLGEFAGKLRDVKKTREIHPKVMSFETWCRRHGDMMIQ